MCEHLGKIPVHLSTGSGQYHHLPAKWSKTFCLGKGSPPGLPFFPRKKLTSNFFENETSMRETNFTLGPIQKSLYLILLYQFTFAHNRPKTDISGAHYITFKAFAMALGDGTK